MKNKKIICASILATFMLGACNKTIDESPLNTDEHGIGANLDQAIYLATEKTNFDQLKTDLVSKGFGSIVNSVGTNSTTIQPASLILNHPPIGDQGKTGTCVSWSTGWAASGTLNNEYPITGITNPRSGWYVYQKDHSSSRDCSATDGMYITSGLSIIKSYGVPAYSLDSSLGSPCTAPASAINTAASKDRIGSYSAISSVAQIKTALNMRLPVEMGLDVYTSFDSAFKNGTILKTTNGTLRGGHAVCIVGYDDTKNAVLIQNSWGTGGGDPQNPGCLWIDYGLITNRKMGIELYTVSR